MYRLLLKPSAKKDLDRLQENLWQLNPDLTAAVGSQWLAEAQSTGAKILVSACQQCERTLSMAARRDKVRMKVMDIAELVRRALVSDN